MSGPYGPNDPNGQWAQGQGNPDPNGAYGAPQFGQQGQQPQWGQPQSGPPQWGQPGQPPQWAGQPQTGPVQQGQPQPGQPQWGQQPGQNPDQQWGQPQWGPQPGQPQWGPPAQPAKKSKAPLFVGLGILALVVAAAGIAIAVWILRVDTLDQAAAQAGVEKIVTQSYGAEQVEGVTCPAGQEVIKGESFECELTVDGTMKKVTVTFTDDEGTYEVSRPS